MQSKNLSKLVLLLMVLRKRSKKVRATCVCKCKDKKKKEKRTDHSSKQSGKNCKGRGWTTREKNNMYISFTTLVCFVTSTKWRQQLWFVTKEFSNSRPNKKRRRGHVQFLLQEHAGPFAALIQLLRSYFPLKIFLVVVVLLFLSSSLSTFVPYSKRFNNFLTHEF